MQKLEVSRLFGVVCDFSTAVPRNAEKLTESLKRSAVIKEVTVYR